MPRTSARQGLGFWARSSGAALVRSVRAAVLCTPSLGLPLCRKSSGRGQWYQPGPELLPQNCTSTSSSFPPLRPGERGPLPYPGGSDRHPGTPPGAWSSLRVSVGDCWPPWELGVPFEEGLIGQGLDVRVSLSQNEPQTLVGDTEAKDRPR